MQFGSEELSGSGSGTVTNRARTAYRSDKSPDVDSAELAERDFPGTANGQGRRPPRPPPWRRVGGTKCFS